MDYKKLHENALAALQQMVSEGKITEEIARSICTDFIKESEDERIRKELISLFQDCIHGVKHCYTRSDSERWLAWLEKQGEQKPIEWDADDLLKRNQIMDILQEYNRTELMDWLEKQGEQKSTWSEEDEEMFDAIIADIQFAQKAHTRDVNQVVYEREVDWLKSLKSRVQPKQEWSEEDEKMWPTISDILWEGYKLSDRKVSWNEIRCWLLPKIKIAQRKN